MAAVSSSGSVHVFVRNAGGGLMCRREQQGGKWGPWTDLQGSMLQDPPAVVAHASGRVEVMAGGQDLIMRWVQDRPDGDLRRALNIPISVTRGTAAVLETAPDRATYYWTDPATGGSSPTVPAAGCFRSGARRPGSPSPCCAGPGRLRLHGAGPS
ncbi:hypothetical protein ACIO93_09185 [Streptomyces sp. NPDC087903]|uniref:hypothetical protein n=1 Tax=Streptomyces sp. NPDC087903 TaxID=3365819 RepID=UPI0037F12D81